MKVEAVVLVTNYNGREHLGECLRSVFAQTYREFKAVLVDDCSIDGSVGYVKGNFPEVDVFLLKKNSGFAKAVNKAIRYCMGQYKPKYVALLNNDARADADWLKNLVAAAESEGSVAAVASNMLYWDEPDTVNSHGATCTILGDGQDIDMGLKASKVRKPKRDVLAACWGAALLKADAIREVGLTDGRYFAYLEDLDWGWRANIYGYKVVYEEDAVVYHKHGAYWASHPMRKTYLCKRNALRTILKNYELKTLVRIMSPLAKEYWRFFYGYLGGITKASPKERAMGVIILPASILWNILYSPETCLMRWVIQSRRMVTDSKIMELMVG